MSRCNGRRLRNQYIHRHREPPTSACHAGAGAIFALRRVNAAPAGGEEIMPGEH